jgi:hypothetical protein
VSGRPAGSVAASVPAPVVFWVIVNVPSLATGGCTVGTVIVTVMAAVLEVRVPSLTWKVKVSVPLAPALAV